MSQKRKNKGSGAGAVNQPWFLNNVERQRKRKKAARQARKKNR